MSILVEKLTLARAHIPIFTDLSFGVAPGKTVILKGANGSGKTTLLRALAGLIEPTSGKIDLAGPTPVYFGHLDGIKPQLTVRENLSFWAAVHGNKAPENSVEQAVATFELDALADRLAAFLSAGQRRRLSLARLKLSVPKCWLLDEPTVSLDQTATLQFAKIVDAHRQSGGISLIATHIDMPIEVDQTIDLDQFQPSVKSSVDPFLQGQIA
jgi:heme exporter protein A